jgi:hypothetical protein
MKHERLVEPVRNVIEVPEMVSILMLTPRLPRGEHVVLRGETIQEGVLSYGDA